jgi:homoserine O-acetyltransferase
MPIASNERDLDHTGVGLVQTRLAPIDLPKEGITLECGARLTALTVAYEAYGVLNAARDNVVFICHALTGDAHAAGYHDPSDKKLGWWDAMIGPDKGIDTRYYYVICANVVGGCKGTTGPTSIDPETGRPYGSRFPPVSTRDMVRVHRLLLEHLGIEKVNALVGGSFGGMQVLEWITLFPHTVERAVCIASGASLSAQALAFDIVGRHAIVSDPNWHHGDYLDTGVIPEQGLARARQIGHITYLSQEMIDQKFGREKSEKGSVFEVERYLQYKGEHFVKRFDANSYLRIMEAMDAFDLAERYGSLQDAFARVRAKILIVALSSDWLFPSEQSLELASALIRCGKSVSYCRLDAPHGHDAFLVDITGLSKVVRAFLPWVERSAKPPGKLDDGGSTLNQLLESNQLARIGAMVKPGARVVDLGCGDGDLLEYLRERYAATGLGIDIDIQNIVNVIDKGHDAFQADIDVSLAVIPDGAYQYAILSQTLQAVKHPRTVLQEMLRIAEIGIVAFANRGNWRYRFDLLWRGQMPKEVSAFGRWYDSMEIHPFTLHDFFELCREDDIEVVDVIAIPDGIVDSVLATFKRDNLGADRALVKVRRRGPREPVATRGRGPR